MAAVCLTLAQAYAETEPAQSSAPHSADGLIQKTSERRSTQPAGNRAFSQTGKASWYGAAFHNKRTSSGERFDMNALTAAHRTLPIPSYARITNLTNGKSVVVRINDRGPFHGGRIVDVSKGAAAKLGFLQRGSAQVKIETLGAGGISDGGAGQNSETPVHAQAQEVI